MALARADDPARTVAQATAMEEAAAMANGPVCLLQCGSPSALADDVARLLDRSRRKVNPILVKDRAAAQSVGVLAKIAVASAVWVFADDLLGAFFDLFATDTAFVLRARAREGVPVIGIGNGALALGGLLLANKICTRTEFELVSGLGWAPRVLIDGGDRRDTRDVDITHATLTSLPGLLALDLGQAGGARVDGGRIESIGAESIVLSGAGEQDGETLAMELQPGQFTVIAPPPFAPFERGLLPAATVEALAHGLRRPGLRPISGSPPRLRQAPDASRSPASQTSMHAPTNSGRVCPMCKKVHRAEPALAAA